MRNIAASGLSVSLLKLPVWQSLHAEVGARLQVSERYKQHWKAGLTQEGLQKTYEDGYGDVDNDYDTLFWSEQV